MKLMYTYETHGKLKNYFTKNTDKKQVMSALKLIEGSDIKIINVKGGENNA